MEVVSFLVMVIFISDKIWDVGGLSTEGLPCVFILVLIVICSRYCDD